MKKPTLTEIDQVRKRNMRPNVVGCILHNKKILFVYSKEHNLWQFPQGGIGNQEEIETAFYREMEEELGRKFSSQLSVPEVLLYKEVLFENKLHGSRKLITDNGEDRVMKGKGYYVVISTSKTDNIAIDQTEFDDASWVSHKAAYQFVKDIYQPKKQDLYVKILYAIAKEYPELI